MVHPYKAQHDADRASKRSAIGGMSTATDGMSAPTNTQPPQSPEDKHGPGYDNDTSGWVHGEGEDATKKPGFDHTRKG